MIKKENERMKNENPRFSFLFLSIAISSLLFAVVVLEGFENVKV